MSDLIDRQVAIDEFGGVKVDEENCTEYDIGYNDGIDFAVSRLSVLPSVDAVEVVRCRDCEHYFTSDMERAKNHGAECTMMNRRTMPEDYCSYGQKM